MIRLTRTVWRQLAILAAVTVIACGIMAFGFINVPALLGIGRYTVTVDLPATGGLYPTSVVTYRGSEIGRVTSVDVTRNGARAVLTLDSDVEVPAEVTAAHVDEALHHSRCQRHPRYGLRLRNFQDLRDLQAKVLAGHIKGTILPRAAHRSGHRRCPYRAERRASARAGPRGSR